MRGHLFCHRLALILGNLLDLDSSDFQRESLDWTLKGPVDSLDLL